jgi:hypothetical protein
MVDHLSTLTDTMNNFADFHSYSAASIINMHCNIKKKMAVPPRSMVMSDNILAFSASIC